MKLNVNNMQNMDSNINKRVADIMLSQYKIGLQKEEDMNSDSGSDTEINTVNPTSTVALPRSKSKGISVAGKSYSASSAQTRVIPPVSSSNKTFTEFMSQSKLLDNELDQMVSSFKYNNKEEFFSGSGISVKNKTITGGALFTDDEVHDMITNATPQKIEDIIEDLQKQLSAETDPVQITDMEESLAQLKDILQHSYIVNEYREVRDDFIKVLNQTDLYTLRSMRLAEQDETKRQFIKRFGTEYPHVPYAKDDPDESIHEMENGIQLIGELYQDLQKYENAPKHNLLDYIDQNTYDKLTGAEKKEVDAIFASVKYDKNALEELHEYLKEKGYDIARRRSNKKGDMRLNEITNEDVFDTYGEHYKDLPSKRGIKIVNDIETSTLKDDMLVMIKKISNIVSTLLPLAQALYTSKFKGSDYQENITLTELYKDMDEKMYILTSLNRTNTQLVKLDKNFTKLFDLVMNGINQFVPPSMTGGSVHGKQPRHKIDHLYYL